MTCIQEADGLGERGGLLDLVISFILITLYSVRRAQHGLGFDLNRNTLRCYKQLPSAVLENPTGLFFDCANEFIDFKGSRKVIDLLKCRVNFLLTCQGKSRLMKT